ncbi:MAG: hypothetical protein NT067_04185 [Candidatus Diapherotrites archaeon]|nr:hypothetical protein [Candidatus Diapherotrites archaeon]
MDTFNEAYSAQYLLVTSQRVEFEKDMTLTRELIIHKTNVGIVGQQLCLSLGDFSGNSEFQGTTQMITYKGNNSREAKFSALCAPGKELLSQIGEVGQYPEIKKEWVSDCECVTDPALQEQVCCLVALRAPR